MRRLWLAAVGLGLSCTMINPAFEDGRIADEAAGSDEQVESSDSIGESGSGSGEESTTETGPDPTESSDVTETGPNESSTDAESSSTTDPSTTDTTDTTTDSESTDTGGVACAGLVPANECEMCSVEACCTLDNFDCFNPDKSEGCSCVIDCLSLEGLLDLCAVDCLALLVKNLADETFNCISENCGQVCP